MIVFGKSSPLLFEFNPNVDNFNLFIFAKHLNVVSPLTITISSKHLFIISYGGFFVVVPTYTFFFILSKWIYVKFLDTKSCNFYADIFSTS